VDSKKVAALNNRKTSFSKVIFKTGDLIVPSSFSVNNFPSYVVNP
jgi:hypothetical protein